MEVIDIIKLKLKSLLDNTYTSTSEKHMSSDIEYLITKTILNLDGFSGLKVFESNNIRTFENIQIVLNDKLLICYDLDTLK